MRISDDFLDCVAFIGREEQGKPVYRGTGFFVGIPTRPDPNRKFIYFVTAQHIAQKLVDVPFKVRVNTKVGGVTVLSLPPGKWWIHPTDAQVDIAVFIWAPGADVSYNWFQIEMLLSDKKVVERRISIGDEVFMTGLFASHMGNARNHPIVRTGNIAMMPGERVPTKHGDMEVYLVEARSIGGISGSPVFVRETAVMSPGGGLSATFPLIGLGPIHLLSVMHGHWDLPVDAGVTTVTDAVGGGSSVNMGIAIVTPAQKLLDILYQPKLEAIREAVERLLADQLQKPSAGDITA